MRLILSAITAAAVLLPFTGRAQSSDATHDHGTLSIYFENDLFAGTDHYYTNGAKISWSSPDLGTFRQAPAATALLPMLDAVHFFNRDDFTKNITISLGQDIYTPNNTTAAIPPPNDRPYAGWLYGEVGLVLKNESFRHTFALDIGVVGPWSYAEETQDAVHRARGFAVPQGWAYQLHNELGVAAVYEFSWRLTPKIARVGLDQDFIPHAGFVAGNVYDYINVGGEYRVGWNLPDDFGTPGIAPGADATTHTNAPRPVEHDFGAYLFARTDGRVVARNIFLDGNTFGGSRSVDHRWLVADLSAGVSTNYKNNKLTYALVYRTSEFVGQKAGEVFGSITLSVQF